MPKKPLPLLALLPLLAIASTAHAEDKLDQILEELKSLRAQVESLEARIDAMEGDAAAPPAAGTSLSSEIKPRERKSWFDSMRVELKKAEVRASGAWTDPSSWDGIETGLTADEVVAILGEPTQRKFSVRRDTDEILIYVGDLAGNGDPIEGEIRIYKGKVRRFTVPDFPSED